MKVRGPYDRLFRDLVRNHILSAGRWIVSPVPAVDGGVVMNADNIGLYLITGLIALALLVYLVLALLKPEWFG